MNDFKAEIEKAKSIVKELSQVFKDSDRNIPDFYEQEDRKDLYIIRDGFARDRDRILFSRAFRRLEHKAQIYTHEKGDHFRTRLTHSLEVMQIARSIALNIGANETLTEAIAIGHDIGHTPFGHQGERTIDSVLRGEDDLGGKIAKSRYIGGFKHNIHSVRVLDIIEAKEKIGSGLNLSWQVLDGVLKHTSTKKPSIEFDIYNGIVHKKIKSIYETLELECASENKVLSRPITLEGQIVRVSDEIAQRQHDIDDGLRDRDLRIDIMEIKENLVVLIKSLLDFEYDQTDLIQTEQVDNLKELLEVLTEESSETNMEDIDLKEKMKFVRNIINFFIKDVTLEIFRNVLKPQINVITAEEDQYITSLIANYSKYGKEINNYIEQLINTQIINSFDVNRFDGKAVYIIRQIFKAYYDNPSQMPPYMLRRIMNSVNQIPLSYNCKIVFKGEDELEISNINFSSSDKIGLKTFIDILKLEFDEAILIINNTRYYIKLDQSKNSQIKLLGFDPRDGEISENQICEYLNSLNTVYLRNIADHIAGMTDNYAKSEYKHLYLV